MGAVAREVEKSLRQFCFQPKESFNDKNAKDTLLFIYDTDHGKVAVKMDYEVKLRDQLTSKKFKANLNVVKTASVIDEDLKKLQQFEVLWGEL